MGKNNAKMTDLSLYIQAGMDPNTGLPLKMADPVVNCHLKGDIKKFLRIIDEQDACNRYKWTNLPCNITSEELERLLYYKGQLVFFYHEATDTFYFMPYALDGTIDFYGRYNTVHPVPMTSGQEGVDKKARSAQEMLLSQIKLNIAYDVVLPEDLTYEKLTSTGVILRDYTNQLPQTIIPRQLVNDSLLDVMADTIPFMRTALQSGTGVKGVRVDDADQAKNVLDAGNQITAAALQGQPYVPITAPIEIQELTGGNLSKADEFFLALQSLDNLRLKAYGLENGGLFEKKAHVLQDEQAVNQQAVGRVYQDGLSIRQHFCDIVNSIFGLMVWCEPSESAVDADINQDGVVYDVDRNKQAESQAVAQMPVAEEEE